MDFPTDVLHHINVAVVVMILKTTHGYTFESLDDIKDTGMSDEMWVMSEKLHDILIECLGTEDSVLKFINWFFDGIRKSFGSKSNINDDSLSLPEICFQCERPYTNGGWCRYCEAYLFEANFKNWSTGSVELNKLIRQSQLNSINDKNFLKWIPFSEFKHLKDIGSGGFSNMYSARWSNDPLDGTLQQWVTNMEIQIILDYVKSHDVHFTEDDWNAILSEFMKKMKTIFESRKTLKCKPLTETGDAESTKGSTKSSRISSRINSRVNSLRLKRKDSFSKIKGLFKSLKKKSNSSIRSSPSSDSVYSTSKKMIKSVPVTTSPLKKRLYQTVALKRLNNSTNISSKFMKEFISNQLALNSDRILRCFGFTQDPETNDYLLALQYANDGDLNQYLRKNFVTIDWWQRLEILREIVRGIKDIHDNNLIHHNLHGGNILRHVENSSSNYLIADFGLYFPSDSTDKSLGSKLFGVLPFIAPEVLRGGIYTKSSDIYSLGILMWQITSGIPPFLDRSYDFNLAKDICEGLRPDIITGTPDRYIDLMKRCWDSNPNNRPNIDSILEFTLSRKDNLGPFTEAEKFRLKTLNNSNQNSNSDLDSVLIFPSSKLLDFNNLPEPKNSKIVPFKSGTSDLSLNSADDLKFSENKPQGNHQINLSIDSAVGISPMK